MRQGGSATKLKLKRERGDVHVDHAGLNTDGRYVVIEVESMRGKNAFFERDVNIHATHNGKQDFIHCGVDAISEHNPSKQGAYKLRYARRGGPHELLQSRFGGGVDRNGDTPPLLNGVDTDGDAHAVGHCQLHQYCHEC